MDKRDKYEEIEKDQPEEGQKPGGVCLWERVSKTEWLAVSDAFGTLRIKILIT